MFIFSERGHVGVIVDPEWNLYEFRKGRDEVEIVELSIVRRLKNSLLLKAEDSREAETNRCHLSRFFSFQVIPEFFQEFKQLFNGGWSGGLRVKDDVSSRIGQSIFQASSSQIKSGIDRHFQVFIFLADRLSDGGDVLLREKYI
jgi:hypothetical protein